MIPATADLRPLVEGKIARTLAADRYLDLPSSEDRSEDTAWRTRSCDRIRLGLTQTATKLATWHGSTGFTKALQSTGRPVHLIRAKQTSRLLLNLGGSALENGGLSLDRMSGLPTIPGSAIKGIARREALLTVRTADSSDDRATWLANIAEDFGWSPDDWSDHGDFAQACEMDWSEVRHRTNVLLAETFNCQPDKLPAAFQGRVCFLSALPETAPAIVTEILTCHHPKYYESSDSKSVALDNEDLRPIVFPSIEKGATWVFPLYGLDSKSTDRCEEAARFLEAGLRQGIGAKTGTGYGRFTPVAPFADNPPALSGDDVRLSFVTPCMCAGADQQVAELRVASLRGELRWWFRAIGGTKEQETEVFGGISGKARSSALILEITSETRVPTPWITEVRKDRNGRSINFLQDINTDASYLWHFAAVAGACGKVENRLWLSGRKAGQPNPRATLSPGSDFVLHSSWRRPVPPEVRTLFDRSWNAFLCFGAIGLRANRAMGCWMPKGVKVDHNQVIDELRHSGFHVTVSDQTFAGWKAAIDYLGAWMKHRLRKEHRVGTDEKSQIPSPLGSANPRQSSAVRLRVLKVGENKFRPLAFEAPHNRVLSAQARGTPVLSAPGLLRGPAPQPEPPTRQW